MRCLFAALFTLPLTTAAVDQSAAVAYWERAASPAFAHIKYDQHLGSEVIILQRWKQQWLDRWAGSGWLRGKRVGDYGIGAGLLAKELCKNHSIGHYVGFDIATRSLAAASKKIQEETTSCPHTLILVSGPIDFKAQHLDVLISQQVIQHFPSKAYTEAWLEAIALARIPKVFLEVRTPVDQRPVFNEWSSTRKGLTTDHVASAVAVSCAWIAKRLPSYTLDDTWQTASGSNPQSKVLNAWTFNACAFSLN